MHWPFHKIHNPSNHHHSCGRFHRIFLHHIQNYIHEFNKISMIHYRKSIMNSKQLSPWGIWKLSNIYYCKKHELRLQTKQRRSLQQYHFLTWSCKLILLSPTIKCTLKMHPCTATKYKSHFSTFWFTLKSSRTEDFSLRKSKNKKHNSSLSELSHLAALGATNRKQPSFYPCYWVHIQTASALSPVPNSFFSALKSCTTSLIENLIAIDDSYIFSPSNITL